MSNKIIDALNKDREEELSDIVQYMKHHYEGEGMESPEILEIFKEAIPYSRWWRPDEDDSGRP